MVRTIGRVVRRVLSSEHPNMGVAAATGEARLLERETVLESLHQALADARAGRGRLVLVAGEAGVGKSAVVRHFCDEASKSARVLWGGSDALFTPRPLGPLVDIGRVTGNGLRELVEDGAKPHVVATALLEELVTRGPSVVVLEDVHWADEATLDVLRLVGRRVESVPALVVASYRDDELGRSHPLRAVLGELPSREVVSRLSVPCLSREAVAQLAEPYGVDPDELFGRTGGNPFFVTEVLATGTPDVPGTVRDAVLARTARLRGPARALLDAVAIFPGRAELWLLEAVASPAADLVEECLRTGVLTPEQDGMAFRHELARLVVEESITPDRAIALNRLALVALAEPPHGEPDLARVAHHAEAAGEVDAVLRYAPAAAARAAALGAHREAAAQYARALRFGDGLPPSERADLLEHRSRACYLTDDIDEAIEAVEEALELRRALGQRLEEGNSLCWLSDILWCPGRTAESAEAARQAVELLETLPPGIELAWAYTKQGSVDLAVRGLELARELDDTELVIRALGSLGNLAFSDGGREKLEEALVLAREAGLVELAGWALINIVGGAIGMQHYSLAAEYIDEAIDFCSERGLELYRYYALAYRARYELDLGRWDDAAETASVVLRIRRASILPRIFALVALALVRARRGDPGYRDLVEEAWALAEPTDELLRMRPVAAARAEIAWLEGDRDGVAEVTEAVLPLALERDWALLVGELNLWRRRAGLPHVKMPGAAEPYALQLAGGWARAAEWWREVGCPYEGALALAEADEEEPLREALEELRRLEARPAAAIVSRRLRELGVRGITRGPRPSTRGNSAQLTARELDVLRLLSDGLRNAMIAERLFLSLRTVENHVSAILRKLNAQSRGEAVAEAARLALLKDR
jgi:DNA-binding CsgD family transcriptional regulator/tetratricopeptide (TPR) repeat protein